MEEMFVGFSADKMDGAYGKSIEHYLPGLEPDGLEARVEQKEADIILYLHSFDFLDAYL